MTRRTPINFITVLCDSRTVQTIALMCKCGWRWTERIPQELHDSRMICEFTCEKCAQRYHLRDKVLHRVMEDASDVRLNKAHIAVDNKRQFDA